MVRERGSAASQGTLTTGSADLVAAVFVEQDDDDAEYNDGGEHDENVERSLPQPRRPRQLTASTCALERRYQPGRTSSPTLPTDLSQGMSSDVPSVL